MITQLFILPFINPSNERKRERDREREREKDRKFMTKFALIATSGDATVPTSLAKIAGTNES